MPTACGTVSVGSWPGNSIGEDTALEIRFGFEFDSVPAVAVLLSSIDAASPNSKRIDAWVSDETRSGFRLHARTWEDAATYSLKASWVATSDHAVVQLGSVSLGKEGAHLPVLDEEHCAVDFPRPFACTPDVVVGLSAVDALGGGPAPLAWPEASGAHPRGCALRCVGWATPEARGLRLPWVASASPASLQAGTVEVGGQSDPLKDGVDRVIEVFFPKPFDKSPCVVTALAGVDADNQKHLRIETWADAVSPSGFRLHARTWEDSVTWRVRVSWMATPYVHPATASPIPPHQPPAQFIVDGPPLGKGWCAVTHRAKDPTNGNVYAIKTSRYPYKQHEQELSQELRNLMRLPVHLNLLRYHECILQADRLHIVTEYLDAYTFVHLVPGPDGPFGHKHPAPTVLRWLAQLLDGLAHLHAAGLVHRDLHGENILVEKAVDGSPSDGPRAVRIIDFGASGFYGDTLSPRMMSGKAGVFQYLSPERRRGDAFDDRDDVWAAGCHLTELASGSRICQRAGCGPDGADFASAEGALRQAVVDCGRTGIWCAELAGVLLVQSREARPRASAGRDMAMRCLALTCGKRKLALRGAIWSCAEGYRARSRRRRLQNA